MWNNFSWIQCTYTIETSSQTVLSDCQEARLEYSVFDLNKFHSGLSKT